MTNIPENAPLEELPAYWQEVIRKLRSENHELRTRIRHRRTKRPVTD